MRRESREPLHKAFLCQASAWGVTPGEATRRRSVTAGSGSVLMIGLRVAGLGLRVALVAYLKPEARRPATPNP